MPLEPIYGPRRQRTLYLPLELNDALNKAQRQLHISGNGLLTQIIREWLSENGHLSEPEREEAGDAAVRAQR